MPYCQCHYRKNVDEEYRKLERTWRESRDPEVRLQLRRIDDRTGKVYDANFICCNLPMHEEPAFWARTLTCEDCGKSIKVCCNQKMTCSRTTTRPREHLWILARCHYNLSKMRL